MNARKTVELKIPPSQRVGGRGLRAGGWKYVGRCFLCHKLKILRFLHFKEDQFYEFWITV